MLLTFMFDRVRDVDFCSLKKNHPIVLPGDPLPKGKLSLCLTFDNAWYDFYHFIFPVLKKLEIRAVLGVPTRYILDSTDLPPEERLNIPSTLAMQDGFFDQKAPFCTWKELKEMVQSGFVEVASQSHMHCNLTFNFVDLDREVVKSKNILETNLRQPINTFIYPFGKENVGLHEYVAQYYPYAFRMGTALNTGWGNGKRPLNRVVYNPSTPLSYFNLFKYSCKGLIL